MKKVCVSWSGGRDSTLMLYNLLKSGEFNVSSLLTTLNAKSEKVLMHDIPHHLLQKQVSSLGIPLKEIWFDEKVSNDVYEKVMKNEIQNLVQSGHEYMAFGDLFLEDIRKYREKNLADTGLQPIFPLWGMTSEVSSQAFLNAGFKATIICVDSDQLDPSFTGAEYNQAFLDSLPDQVDPCGENGEFHTFVYDGPLFDTPVSFDVKGSYIKFDRFHYAELY
ncbi:Dph6-related ATP pyrophosphatase [Falsibacillus albus]|nr:ATP-binding protein [Falsibacillus albus]